MAVRSAQASQAGGGEGRRSGTAAARRKTLTRAGMEREVAEAVVDMVDGALVPFVTREESDSRFELVLDRFQAEGEKHRGEIESRFAKVDSQFAKVDSRFAEIDSRFAEIDSRFGKVEARLDVMDSRFGEMEKQLDRMDGRLDRMEGVLSDLRVSVVGELQRLRADMTWRMLLAFGAMLAVATALNRLFGSSPPP